MPKQRTQHKVSRANAVAGARGYQSMADFYLQVSAWEHRLTDAYHVRRKRAEQLKKILQAGGTPPAQPEPGRDDDLSKAAILLASMGADPAWLDEMPDHVNPPLGLPVLAMLEVMHRRRTIKEKASILEAAELIWCEVAPADDEVSFHAMLPLEAMWVPLPAARFLAEVCDMDAYMGRPGVGLDRERARAKFIAGERLVSVKGLQQQLQARKSKGY